MMLSLNFELEGNKNSVGVILHLPGYDSVEFRLNESEPSFEITYKLKDRKFSHSYKELDWYFVQPELNEETQNF